MGCGWVYQHKPDNCLSYFYEVFMLIFNIYINFDFWICFSGLAVWKVIAHLVLLLNDWFQYSITPIIRINWYREPSGCAENPDNLIFLWK
jgi:hypothetical protein